MLFRNDGMKHLKTVLRRERLPLPPVPRELHSQLRQLDDWLWGTHEHDTPLYDIQTHAEDAVSADKDFALVGLDGHGTNAWYFHCFISKGPVTVLVQAPWGGAMTDAKNATDGLLKRFTLAEKLLHTAQEIQSSGLHLPGRLVVQQSSTVYPRWAWVQPGVTPEWQEEFANAMTPALESLQFLKAAN